MTAGVFLAWSSPVSPDHLAEFDEWYSGTHIPQVRAAVPSISGATRYELIDPAGSSPSYRYLTVYELDSADIPAMDLTQRPPLAEWYRAYPS